MPRRSKGIAGSAVFVGTLGVYLVYVGLKDVPFFDGLRSLLRQETPTAREAHNPYVVAGVEALVNAGLGSAGKAQSDTGINGLRGNAAAAYPAIRAVAPGQILGFGLRTDMSSDHPRGLAMDAMTRENAAAQAIIGRFRQLPGAKYWIWNRQIANRDVDNWRIRPYNGPHPHDDHVHLSFS